MGNRKVKSEEGRKNQEGLKRIKNGKEIEAERQYAEIWQKQLMQRERGRHRRDRDSWREKRMCEMQLSRDLCLSQLSYDGSLFPCPADNKISININRMFICSLAS